MFEVLRGKFSFAEAITFYPKIFKKIANAAKLTENKVQFGCDNQYNGSKLAHQNQRQLQPFVLADHTVLYSLFSN